MTSITNWESYRTLVEKAGSLSRLFSASDVPFLHPRFVENLYCATTGSTNLGRSDVSFDAKRLDGSGVGIKTFRVASFRSQKTEKIAEFTAQASAGRYANMDPDEIVFRVANDRNRRIVADASAFGIELTTSIYHCLVRAENGCMVHEEKYALIDISSVQLLNKPKAHGPIKFTDQQGVYSFYPAKNTLYKTFDIGSAKKSKPIQVVIREGLFDEILGKEFAWGREDESTIAEDFVVLPLYSDRSGKVEAKSGINQWNAAGRQRKFGEAYIPVPSKVHRLKPGFFPSGEKSFIISMPDGSQLSAKVCQENGKALMSNPNDQLASWLFSQIDGDMETAKNRLSKGRPYTYDDLLSIGRDSVKILKRTDGTFQLFPAGIGDFEDFIESLEVDVSG
jgi:hypothetical protein